MTAINVLILSAGHQVMLAKCFLEAQKLRPNPGLIICADAEKLSPSLSFADVGLFSPKSSDKNFIDWILGIAEQYAPLLILTLYERDLFVLESIRHSISARGCKLVGLPNASLEICLDKQKTAQFCEKLGLTTPDYWTRENVSGIDLKSYPLIAKRRDGRGSRGQCLINSPKTLNNFLRSNSHDFIFQTKLSGTEYGIDVVNDLNGNLSAVFAREKLLMRNGETSIARIVDPLPFIETAKLLSSNLCHQGCMDVDIIVSNTFFYIIDINPRFGGGYPFSHFAGANLPLALLSWASHDSFEFENFKPDVGKCFSKFSSITSVSL